MTPLVDVLIRVFASSGFLLVIGYLIWMDMRLVAGQKELTVMAWVCTIMLLISIMSGLSLIWAWK